MGKLKFVEILIASSSQALCGLFGERSVVISDEGWPKGKGKRDVLKVDMSGRQSGGTAASQAILIRTTFPPRGLSVDSSQGKSKKRPSHSSTGQQQLGR